MHFHGDRIAAPFVLPKARQWPRSHRRGADAILLAEPSGLTPITV
jgi:hypothetical protein